MRRMKGCESWRYLFLGIFLGLNILELGDWMKGICLNCIFSHLLGASKWCKYQEKWRSSNLSSHDAVQRAKRLVEVQLPIIHKDLQLLKSEKCDVNSSSCEILEYSACHFSSSCKLVPGICSILQELEAQGVQIIGSSMMEASQLSSRVPTEFPGRLRLCCSLDPVETVDPTEACFWLETSASKIWPSERVKFFLVDLIDPKYLLEESQLEISGEPFQSLLWLQAVLAGLGDGFGGRSFPGSSSLLDVPKPARFSGQKSWGLPWIHFAASLGTTIRKDLCAVKGLASQLSMALQSEDYGKAKILLGMT